MNYLYGWNPVSEFILDELEETGAPVGGVIIGDDYLSNVSCPGEVNMIPASKVSLAPGDKVINCLGYKNLRQRIDLGEQLLLQGVLRGFISKNAKVHRTTSIGIGTILLGDVVVESHCEIGKHCLLWGGSRVCHDSRLRDGVFLAAGSIIGGGCTLGDECSLGFNSSTREKSIMPEGTKVGANRFWRPSV